MSKRAANLFFLAAAILAAMPGAAHAQEMADCFLSNLDAIASATYRLILVWCAAAIVVVIVLFGWMFFSCVITLIEAVILFPAQSRGTGQWN